jgi:3-oxosteroid 1-dehydrogenase
MAQWDETYDFVIIGSGGGSMAAALAAKTLGKRALIAEKEDLIGGSTAMSGGVWWIPNNPVMARVGIDDSYERAQTYLQAVVGDAGPAASPARREYFLKTGPRLVDFLEKHGMKFIHATGWSDYYDDRPGGEPRGRSLEAERFNIRELGAHAAKLRPKATTMPIDTHEGITLLLMKRTLAGKITAFKLAARMMLRKLTGKVYVGGGTSIQGRMFQIALRENLAIWTRSPASELVVETGRVTGVVVMKDGKPVRVCATDGVLINAGGFSHSLAMRQQYHSEPPTTAYTNANPGDTGEMIQAAMALGAATDFMDEAWWTLSSRSPDGSLPARERTPPMHVMDITKPHCIVVDSSGQRYVNESASYMSLGRAMIDRHKHVSAIPSWAVMDSRHRRNYSWAMQPPGFTPSEWLSSGYMKRADTLDELARVCGIDAAGLKAGVARFNGFAHSGIDLDFRRGERAYDRRQGDPTVTPNNCLGAIEEGPFYAVELHPGDVGTCGGLLTDEHARVLRTDGSPIPGLYATGNSTASVFGRTYPGAGASIAGSFVFGFLAAHHAAGAPIKY